MKQINVWNTELYIADDPALFQEARSQGKDIAQIFQIKTLKSSANITCSYSSLTFLAINSSCGAQLKYSHPCLNFNFNSQ